MANASNIAAFINEMITIGEDVRLDVRFDSSTEEFVAILHDPSSPFPLLDPLTGNDHLAAFDKSLDVALTKLDHLCRF